MLRIKLIVLVALALAALALAGVAMSSSAGSQLVTQAEEKLKSSNEVVRLANRVDDYALIYAARTLAERSDLISAMGCPDEFKAAQPQLDEAGQPIPGSAVAPPCPTDRHTAVLQAAKAAAQELDEDRKANEAKFLTDRDLGHAVGRPFDILVISDARGVVVARVGFDMDDWFGSKRVRMSEFPVVARTENLGPQHDIVAWSESAAREESPSGTTADVRMGAASDAKMTQLASAPIFLTAADGTRRYAGAVTIGHAMTNDSALEDASLLTETDLVYFMMRKDGAVTLEGTSVTRDPQFVGAMRDARYFQRSASGSVSDTASTLQQVLQPAALGSIYEFEYNGERYLTMPTAFSQGRANLDFTPGFLVVSAVRDAVAPISSISTMLPAAAFVLFLLVAFGIVFVLKSFFGPIDEISKGIQEVIAGNKEYMWPVDEKSWLSDMSHSLNVMSATLQGKRAPDAEDTEGDKEWAGMVGGGGSAASGGAKPAGIQGLGAMRKKPTGGEGSDAG